ncbi:hypothetical protein LVJ94_47970 [Pendulispora rubella]|uniref:Mannosylglycerate hydrolase MGH1-like glycoside hydrolase domain-containing protein n=1 Tax=Pendulispora rubella TaxID=2741070 RepID=A0ABZ2L4W9_9BACT
MQQADVARKLARAVLENNRRTGSCPRSRHSYSFVCPAPANYPFQWAWDSAFHAIALTHVDPSLAKMELDCWLAAQRADGFCGHIVLWDDEHRASAEKNWVIALDPLSEGRTTTTIQPPAIVRAVEHVWSATGDEAWLARVLPRVMDFFDWLAADRDPEHSGLLTILQPDESGLDGSPKYDVLTEVDRAAPQAAFAAYERSLRRLHAEYASHRTKVGFLARNASFAWRDVLVNSIYGNSLRALARLCRAAGFGVEVPKKWDRRADRVTAALIETHWDEKTGAFFDRHGRDGRMVRTLTISSLFPLILTDLPRSLARRLVEDHLLDGNEFWLEYPLPSVAATEPSFDPGFTVNAIFRGPTWINTNWYLYWGLRTHGYADVARTLALRTVDMVAKSGMREFYDPRDATGHGAKDFAWSSLVLDLMAAEGWG